MGLFSRSGFATPMEDLSSKRAAELKAQGQKLTATLQVGKQGVTDAIAHELSEQLERTDLVKVKLLQSARAEVDRKDLARDLGELAGATLVEVRGNVALYFRPGRRQRRR